MATITTTDHATTRHHTGGGKQPTTMEHTDLLVDGEIVTTITWVPALLRRMKRNGWTRADYIARIAGRFVDAADYCPRCAEACEADNPHSCCRQCLAEIEAATRATGPLVPCTRCGEQEPRDGLVPDGEGGGLCYSCGECAAEAELGGDGVSATEQRSERAHEERWSA